MKLDLVTIVIPFFNESKTLKRAIESALSQSYGFTELILVDDGSTDSSIDIARFATKSHSRVNLIQSENLGLSVARNKAIEQASGKYITFLDADDVLEFNAVELFVNDIKKTGASVSVSKFILRNEIGEHIGVFGWKSQELQITAMDAVNKMYSNQLVFTAWAKLYKTELVKKIEFAPGLWFEDRPFFLSYLLDSEMVSFIDIPLLSIYTRENSITRKLISAKRITDIQLIWLEELKIAAQHDLKKDLLRIITRNHIQYLYENTLILSIDHPVNRNELQKLIDCSVMQSIKKTRELSIPIGLKLTAHLYFMAASRFIPHVIVAFLLKKIRANQYRSIAILRSNIGDIS